MLGTLAFEFLASLALSLAISIPIVLLVGRKR